MRTKNVQRFGEDIIVDQASVNGEDCHSKNDVSINLLKLLCTFEKEKMVSESDIPASKKDTEDFTL